MLIERHFVEPVGHDADANLIPRYTLQRAAWLWHPDPPCIDEPVVLTFRRTIRLDSRNELLVHLSADERYRFTINGQHVSAGPHRCELTQWCFSSHRVTLEPGEHLLEATVWALGRLAPNAQVTYRPGFILAVDDRPEWDTGQPGWTVCRETHRTFTPYTAPFGQYHVVGPEEELGGTQQLTEDAAWVEPVVSEPALTPQRHGLRVNERCLAPSNLPEMLHAPRRLGRARAVLDGENAITKPIPDTATKHPDLGVWQALLDDDQPMTLEPGTVQAVVIDPQDYVCGYAWVGLSGGMGAEIYWEWTESLWEVDASGAIIHEKGQRDGVVGKGFDGFGDRFRGPGGEASAVMQPLWWRAGRMLRLTVRVGHEPVTIQRLRIDETRYPLERDSTWTSNDTELNATIPAMWRAMQMCAHESYMDCPHYEQMMYVGDTRLEMLTTYVSTPDRRLPRRGIELFDRSRALHGLVLERCPSRPVQSSSTFALLWVGMVHDYALWHDDPVWVRRCMVGVRSMLEQLLPMQHDDQLVRRLPGWLFVDWIKAWQTEPGGICPPSARSETEPSCLINLHLLLALRAAAALEAGYGETLIAKRYTQKAEALAEAIRNVFFNETRGLLQDDTSGDWYSEHAQVLALTTGLFGDDATAKRVFEQLISAQGLERCSIYFSHYLLETYYRFGRGDLLVKFLEAWKQLPKQGFSTTPEVMKSTRSDCHAWGAHPLYHMHASLAGVRPAGEGFKRVRIAPRPGPLRQITAELAHPLGTIHTEFAFPESGGIEGKVRLPQGLSGELHWAGQTLQLHPGEAVAIKDC